METSEEFRKEIVKINEGFSCVGKSTLAWVELGGKRMEPIEFTEDGVFIGRTTGRPSARQAEKDFLHHINQYVKGKHNIIIWRVLPEIAEKRPWDDVVFMFFEKYGKLERLKNNLGNIGEEIKKVIDSTPYDITVARYSIYARLYAE